MELDGKVVVITGAARGIGRDGAIRMAKDGAKVVVSDIDAAGSERVAAEIRDAGGQAIAIACDVSSDAAVEALASTVSEEYRKVDLLINNAANQTVGPGDIENRDHARWRESFEVNVLGSVRMVQSLLPLLEASGGGYIINTASSLAIRPNGVVQHLMPYVTSKGAVLTFTYALAHAMKARGIKVSLFCPGLTATTKEGPRPNRNGWFDGVPEPLTVPGTMEECTSILMQGIRDEAFLISSEPDYQGAVVRLAEHGLDPLSDFQFAR